jgi:hypothetical protein
MWNVSIAAIPGPGPALPAFAAWLAVAAAAALIGLVFVLIGAARRTPAAERPAAARLRRLHGDRAA